jgi:hypothetical protein
MRLGELSASDELSLSEATAVLFHAVVLDRAWTATARREDLTADDIETLGGIAAELRELIASIVEAAHTVVRVAEVVQPPNDGAADSLIPEVRASYEALLLETGGVVPLARQAYADLDVMAEAERTALDNQLQAVRSGGRVQGDLSRRFLCRMANVLMAAGGITVWVPPHAHSAASIAAGVAIAHANRCWELEPAKAR